MRRQRAAAFGARCDSAPSAHGTRIASGVTSKPAAIASPATTTSATPTVPARAAATTTECLRDGTPHQQHSCLLLLLLLLLRLLLVPGRPRPGSKLRCQPGSGGPCPQVSHTPRARGFGQRRLLDGAGASQTSPHPSRRERLLPARTLGGGHGPLGERQVYPPPPRPGRSP